MKKKQKKNKTKNEVILYPKSREYYMNIIKINKIHPKTDAISKKEETL